MKNLAIWKHLSGSKDRYVREISLQMPIGDGDDSSHLIAPTSSDIVASGNVS